MCNNCRSESQALWAIGPPYPHWSEVESGNFVHLVMCSDCHQLWIEAFYEPFASFRYAVKWPSTLTAFRAEHDKDEGQTLCVWHEAQVRKEGCSATPEVLAQIQAHYERARGFVDLRPTEIQPSVPLGKK